MDGDLIQCDKEVRHTATANYWTDMLEKLDDNEMENDRRTAWYDKRAQHYRNEKPRRKEWKRAQRREQIEEGTRRDEFTAFLLLDDYREHNFRAKWRGTNHVGRGCRATPPAWPTPPSTPPRQPAITDRSLTTLEAQPTGIGAPEGRPLRVDVMVARDHAYAIRQLNNTLGYDTPRPVTNDNCHLCDTMCWDHRQLRRNLRSDHPEECTDLFHCDLCKLTFVLCDSTINHHKHIHNVDKILKRQASGLYRTCHEQ